MTTAEELEREASRLEKIGFRTLLGHLQSLSRRITKEPKTAYSGCSPINNSRRRHESSRRIAQPEAHGLCSFDVSAAV